MIRELGGHAEQLSDGDEVMPYLLRQEEAPDVILLDVVMARMNGDACTRELRRSGYPGPIIAVTSNHASWDLANFTEAGFTSVIPKPITLESLAHGIRRVLAEVRAEERRAVTAAASAAAAAVPAPVPGGSPPVPPPIGGASRGEVSPDAASGKRP